MSEQNNDKKSIPTINSVIHATQILELYAAQREPYLSLTQISKSLNMHKTTVYRILRTLESVGWIEQSEVTGQYRLGTGVLLVSSAVAVQHTSRSLIAEEMRKLSRLYNETVVLCALRGAVGICVDMVKSKHSLSIVPENGYIVPLHIGATGKTLLSAQPDHVIAPILATLDDQRAAALAAQLEVIRTQGSCISEGEVDLGVAAICVPLVQNDNIYTLSVSGPQERIQRIGYEAIKDSLLHTASEITRKSEKL